jgi:hypothetical protein
VLPELLEHPAHIYIQKFRCIVGGKVCSGIQWEPSRTFSIKEIMRIKQFLNSVAERIAYWSIKRILLGYAKVFSTGLFSLEAQQDRFQSECKQVSDVFVRSIIALDKRLTALESKEGQ